MQRIDKLKKKKCWIISLNCEWIFIVFTHGQNSPQKDMSLPVDYTAVLLHINAACLAHTKQLPFCLC